MTFTDDVLMAIANEFLIHNQIEILKIIHKCGQLSNEDDE